MPHISSIRLVNVHFNNATQFYDDFRMELGGKNTTFDLENGGGKSLLLLLLLQTVLPKSYLRREKPLSLIFQGGKDRTSHVAVEWILEEGGAYKYLLTGFSARKRKGSAAPAGAEGLEDEEILQAADIEHLNWCVFYNDNRSTGIRALALLTKEAGKKRVAGFEEIRKYVQQMRQKGLPAEVFDKIDQYQSYIAAHHLLSAEWKIIKGINSGENNIESYFRQNATSRKLIENQFVKIVEDVEALNKGEKNKDDSLLLADTLIEIRNRLNEYLRLKGHMTEYEKIKDYYAEFGRRNEEFLKGYLEYEACKMQAAAIRNLIENKLKTLEQEKTATIKKLEHNNAGNSEGQQLKRLLEAGLINHEKEKLLAVQKHQELERDQLAQRQAELENQLNHLLTLEGYGEYRKVKAKISELCQSLQTLAMDGDTLKNDFRKAGGRLRFLTDKLFEELTTSQKNAEETKKQLENKSDQTRQEQIDEEKKASELEVKLDHLIEQETHLQEKLREINDFFLKCGEMDGVLSPEQFLSRLEDELKRYRLENDSVAENIKALETELKNLDLAVVKTEGDINLKQATQKPLGNWLKDYQRERSGMEEKAAGFGKSTIEEYQAELQSLLHQENLNKLEKEIEAGRRRQKKQLSADRGYYVPNEEILSLADQLSAKCEFVQAGIDWIAQAESEEKEIILREMPYLPFSVIVDRGSFDKLKNGRLKLDFSSDYPVPVVNLETVRLKNNSAKEDIYYFCCFAGLLLDSRRYEEYIQGIESVLETMDREILAADTRLAELTGDLSSINAFYGKYPQHEVEHNEKLVETLAEELTSLNEQLQDLKDQKARFLEEKGLLNRRLEELAELIADCQEKIEKLVAGRQTKDELLELREQLSVNRKELAAVQANLAKIKDTTAKLKEQLNAVEEQLKLLLLELHDVEKDKERLAGFAGIENDLAINQVQAEYTALQEAVSGGVAEEDKLRSDLKDNETSLKALRDRIMRDYGGDLEAVERNEANGLTVIIPSQRMIKETRLNNKEISNKLKDANQKVTDTSLALQKTVGKLEEILKAAGADPETVLPRYETESRYQQEIDQIEQLIKSYEEEINRANQELERIKEKSGKLNNQKEDYEAFMEREEVTNEGIIAPETKEYRQFEKEYYRLQDLIRQQGNQWDDRVKTVQTETASFVIREPLEELAKISKPAGAAQCRARKDAFAEYIANIEEQMQKIIKDIQQLESYQEDFTRRCIQRAELVLGHLRKLESLSRIEVYGRRTNMIELKLQELEEKDKHLRVKAHIDGIVREMGEEGVIDRKRIAAKLSTKELLAQIVDMDKAAVRLYKIESIPENSRFYRWENAIGSEGQNNSLYFIFAACLISFIRMLSITNTSVRTKKVIIADNPFGATSAVYLWDPMFKIMKQNDIQLIAPGHRIPREITSRFGVSYLLNQDILQDGRMRVVVKDVRAEEDEDVLRYVDSEQLSLY